MARWSLGKTSPKKRIHRPDCRYALTEYVWAGERTELELFDELVASGAVAWHDAGQCCSQDLDWAIYWVTRRDLDPHAVAHARAKLGTQ